MTKFKSKKKARSYPEWLIALVAIAVPLFAFVGYNLYLDYQDRQKFTEIEETVDTLVSRIENEFDVEDITSNNRCYESSQKLGKGPTICVYETSLLVRAYNNALVSYLVSQEDVVAGSNELIDLLDFWTASEDFSCSLDKTGNLYNLECSDYARQSYYPFTD